MVCTSIPPHGAILPAPSFLSLGLNLMAMSSRKPLSTQRLTRFLHYVCLENWALQTYRRLCSKSAGNFHGGNGREVTATRPCGPKRISSVCNRDSGKFAVRRWRDGSMALAVLPEVLSSGLSTHVCECTCTRAQTHTHTDKNILKKNL